MPTSARSEARGANRDRALALRERVTGVVAVGALALTGILTLTAAASYAGRSDSATPPGGVSPDSSGATEPAAGQNQSGLNPPAEPPQCCLAPVPPAAVSGGS